jgi:tRNA A37 methylthiotransferase MiaB
MAKLKLITFGCQANEADSEKIAGVLAEEGFDLTETAEDADLILERKPSIRSTAFSVPFRSLKHKTLASKSASVAVWLSERERG